jgi:hypothetical protein
MPVAQSPNGLLFSRNPEETTESTEDTETEGEEEGLRILDPEPFFPSGLCGLCVLCGEGSGNPAGFNPFGAQNCARKFQIGPGFGACWWPALYSHEMTG